MALGFVEQVQESASHINSLEEAMGKCLNQPNAGANSGPRELMASTHQSHALVLNRGELPYSQTGFENRFGDESSSIIEASGDLEVLARVPKFSYAPNHHYYLIVKDINTQRLDIIERISYHFRTEVYGYLHNNSVMDTFSDPGTIIPKGTRLRKSIGFDQYNNRTSGCNLNTAYMALDNNMEDSVIISSLCQKKMEATLFRNVELLLNENDIPLNIYGNDEVYKVFPDVGEDVKDGILLAYRREKRDEAIYTQSVKRLQQIMMSDDKITVKGKIIDVDIYCNNPEHICKSVYNQQFNAYYEDRKRMNQTIVNIVGPYKTQNYEISYNLQKFYDRAVGELNGKSFIDKSQFSFIKLSFMVMDSRLLEVGDKVADRYGGKGVVSQVIPVELMPKMANGLPIDIIKNSSTMYGRENAGQVFELETNYISMNILDKIRSGEVDPESALEYILKFVRIMSPEMAAELEKYTSNMDLDKLRFFIESYLQKVSIPLSTRPMTDTMTIDKLGLLYESFPWIDERYIMVPIKDSKGNNRFIKSRRPIIAAPIYHIRLKQFAEEKFSAAALSSTNIKNENAKSKASKNYREPNSNTPIKFGQMESGDFDHMGAEIVVANLLLHSLSPHARRLVEQIATGDPYDVDVKLDSRAKNRSAEILNTRLKTMGYRFVFTRRKKNVHLGAYIPGVEFFEGSIMHPTEGVVFVEDPNYDYKHWYDTLREIDEIRKKNGVNINAVSFIDDYNSFEGEEEVIDFKND